MIEPNFFNILFVIPILNLLVFLYNVFSFIEIPGAFGFAIIGLTIILRLLLHPFFKSQMETAKKMQELKPHLDKLSKKHKNDPKTLQKKQLELFQQHKINPSAGCLFLIIQLPIFIALYQTLSFFLINNGKKVVDEINRVVYFSFLKITTINSWFFGFDLAKSPAQINIWYYYLIPFITAFLQYWQTNIMQKPSNNSKGNKNDTNNEKTNHKEGKNSSEDFQKVINIQMKFIFPLMIAFFAYMLPVGMSLYWNIFSILSIIYYQKLNKNSYGKN